MTFCFIFYHGIKTLHSYSVFFQYSKMFPHLSSLLKMLWSFPLPAYSNLLFSCPKFPSRFHIPNFYYPRAPVVIGNRPFTLPMTFPPYLSPVFHSSFPFGRWSISCGISPFPVLWTINCYNFTQWSLGILHNPPRQLKFPFSIQWVFLQ